MTKLKSKKMSKSTFAVIIMAILMVAMLAFGGTYAWFTSGEKIKVADGAQAVMGRIILTPDKNNSTVTTETFAGKNFLPGENILSDVEFSVTDNSNRASYIFFVVDVKVEKASNGKTETDPDKLTYGEATQVALANLKIAGQTAVPLKNGEDDVPGVYVIETGSISQEGVETFTAAGETYEVSGIEVAVDNTAENNDYQQARFTITLNCQSIQMSGFETAYEAYNALN